ncbi:MAG: hypothetical protein HRT88_17595 [Lentisphaeraceae bacterium]|nr:hypothetical protein [Lentisphaeraceae bacterium]
MSKFTDTIGRLPSFKSRVRNFWDWFNENAARLGETIDAGNCQELSTETLNQTDKLIPGISWSYGVSANDQRHTFTLSAESNPHWIYLTRYWLDCAPDIDNWEFFCFKQASPNPNQQVLKFKELSFSIKGIWLEPKIDENLMLININVWHPTFDKLTEMERFRILFLWLDAVLGESETERWIGQVEFCDTQLENTIPLLELPEYIEELTTKLRWQKPTPSDCYTLYECPPVTHQFLRTDTLIAHTSNMRLVSDYFEYCGDIPDPLIGSNAHFIFINFPITHFPQAQRRTLSNLLEKVMNEVLIKDKSGKVTGYSIGEKFLYLDFIIYDGTASIELIKNTLIHSGYNSDIEYHLWTDI